MMTGQQRLLLQIDRVNRAEAKAAQEREILRGMLAAAGVEDSHTVDTPAKDRVAGVAAKFRETVKAEGMNQTGDGMVGEKDAAKLLGRSYLHLRQLRQEGAGPEWVKQGRILYSVDVLAEWVVRQRKSHLE